MTTENGSAARLSRWQCVLAGGVVATIIAPLFPISLAVGGGLAGYMRRGDTTEGVLVGGLAGLCCAGIMIGTAMLATTFLGLELPGVPNVGSGVHVQLWYLVMIFLFLPSIFAILSAVGGALGVHVLEDDQQATGPVS